MAYDYRRAREAFTNERSFPINLLAGYAIITSKRSMKTKRQLPMDAAGGTIAHDDEHADKYAPWLP